MFTKIFLNFLGIILFITQICAQDNEKADKKIMAANNYLQMGDAETYILKMNEAINDFPSYEPGYMTFAKFYMDRKNYTKALELYEKLYSINPTFNPVQNKLLAECYFYTEDLSKAEYFAQKFINTPGVSAVNLTETKRLMENIRFSKNAPTAADITFQNIGNNVNSEYNEYFPSTAADESIIYFTREIKGDENIWISEKNGNNYMPAKPIDQMDIGEDGTIYSINSTFNDGAHTISPDGRYLFFTSCGRPKNFGGCDIYFASKTGGVWGKPKILPKPVNTTAWESQPCVSTDGRKLFFVSNRPGGIGGADIYMCNVSNKGEFSEPINLGNTINTPYDEDKPFLHPDGKTLYFSSNGHPGFGGKDVFMSKLENGEWQKPINLGRGVNTVGDEVSLFVNALGTKAYLARPQDGSAGRKNLDIFSFDLPNSIKPAQVSYIKGLVLDKSTRRPLKAQVRVNDPAANKTIQITSSDAKNGDFLVPLAIESELYSFWVNKEGYALYSQTYEFTEKTKPQEIIIELIPLATGTKFELRNVFFPTAKFDLKPESKTELDMVVKMLQANPTLKIMISGHTDNVGQESSNQLLSENRAKSVLEFLITAGIEASRLSYKGYGSKSPIAPNDSPENRAKNRRTEIEIQ